MPQAWMTNTPCFSWNARLIASGAAEPPMTARLTEVSVRCSFSQ
jgi:hypothetical protein